MQTLGPLLLGILIFTGNGHVPKMLCSFRALSPESSPRAGSSLVPNVPFCEYEGVGASLRG